MENIHIEHDGIPTEVKNFLGLVQKSIGDSNLFFAYVLKTEIYHSFKLNKLCYRCALVINTSILDLQPYIDKCLTSYNQLKIVIIKSDSPCYIDSCMTFGVSIERS